MFAMGGETTDIGHGTMVMDSKFIRKQWMGFTAKISIKN